MSLSARLWIASVAAAVTISLVQQGVHQIREGYIGVYWRAGRLLDTYGEAGINFMVPMIDRMEEVQINLQTDRVTNIPCGTSGGVIIRFSAIEVVNRLDKNHAIDIIRNYGIHYDRVWIFDKIHHEINQFCSSHTLQEVYIDLFSTLDESLSQALQSDIDKYAQGIKIIAVRVTKPEIPSAILENYSAMEAEKTKLLVQRERANVERVKAETEKMRAEISAQQTASVSKIEKEREISEKQAEQRIKQIEDEMHLTHEKTLADAEFYHKQRQAESNKVLYTREFLEYTYAKSLGETTKIYFGQSIPKMFIENMYKQINQQSAIAEDNQTH